MYALKILNHTNPEIFIHGNHLEKYPLSIKKQG